MKDSEQPFTNSAPQKKAEVTVKFVMKELDTVVIADGELNFFVYILFSVVFDVV